jgi:hypothetical protein
MTTWRVSSTAGNRKISTTGDAGRSAHIARRHLAGEGQDTCQQSTSFEREYIEHEASPTNSRVGRMLPTVVSRTSWCMVERIARGQWWRDRTTYETLACDGQWHLYNIHRTRRCSLVKQKEISTHAVCSDRNSTVIYRRQSRDAQDPASPARGASSAGGWSSTYRRASQGTASVEHKRGRTR